MIHGLLRPAQSEFAITQKCLPVGLEMRDTLDSRIGLKPPACRLTVEAMTDNLKVTYCRPERQLSISQSPSDPVYLWRINPGSLDGMGLKEFDGG
jgi:hypothetical protein